MPSGRLLVVLWLVACMPAVTASSAHAQAGTTVVPAPSGSADQLSPPGGDDLAPSAADAFGATTPAGTSPEPLPDDGTLPGAIAPSTPVDPAPATSAGTPSPPPYLTPGQDAAIQPVSGVARLTDPDIPLEPVRLAALSAIVLAALALALSALLRSLGVRTAAARPVPIGAAPAAGGPLARLRDRTANLADDVRDFLRHSR